jgi:hypothetical protein
VAVPLEMDVEKMEIRRRKFGFLKRRDRDPELLVLLLVNSRLWSTIAKRTVS